MPSTEPVTIAAEVLTCREVHELPGDWDAAGLRRLLTGLEVDTDGAAESDLADLALMALGDLEHREAGVAVLRAVFADSMPTGVRASLAADLEEDRPWEDFADITRQAGIFTAVVLLQRAFPKLFGKPDATRVKVAFTAPTPAEAAALAAAPPAVILRALAPGLGSRSIVTRIYADGLRQDPFPEAENILWRHVLRVDPVEPRRVLAEFYGAQSFLGPLADADPWQAAVKLRPAS